MARIVQSFGHAGESGRAEANGERAPELEAGVPPIFHGLGQGLAEAAGERIEKSGEHLGARDVAAGGLEEGDGRCF